MYVVDCRMSYIESIVHVGLHKGFSLIAGLDCGLDRWTGMLDRIPEDVRLACKTACVVDTSAL